MNVHAATLLNRRAGAPAGDSGRRYSLSGKRVFVAGHRGMAGGAIARRLGAVDCEVIAVGRDEADLRDPRAVASLFERRRPQAIFLAAGTVGGIHANDTYPADFLYDNVMIAANVIHAAHAAGVEKLMFLGSSCIYPKHAAQPITEDALLTGSLEPTNDAYAIAKIAGIKLCDAYRRQHGADFVSAMPTNLYGPGDNYHPQNAHVPAALIRRFDEAKRSGAPDVTVWGTGTPRREFLYVDDLADACVFLMENWSAPGPINVGTGEDVTIAAFAGAVAKAVGYEGALAFDTSKPDGTPRKQLDVSRLTALGWRASTPLAEGLAHAVADYRAGGGRNR